MLHNLGSRGLPNSRFLSFAKQSGGNPLFPKRLKPQTKPRDPAPFLSAPQSTALLCGWLSSLRLTPWSQACRGGAAIATPQLLLTLEAWAAANYCSWSYMGSICESQNLWLLQPPEPESVLACVSVHWSERKKKVWSRTIHAAWKTPQCPSATAWEYILGTWPSWLPTGWARGRSCMLLPTLHLNFPAQILCALKFFFFFSKLYWLVSTSPCCHDLEEYEGFFLCQSPSPTSAVSTALLPPFAGSQFQGRKICPQAPGSASSPPPPVFPATLPSLWGLPRASTCINRTYSLVGETNKKHINEHNDVCIDVCCPIDDGALDATNTNKAVR